jgi:hypothetical protein
LVTPIQAAFYPVFELPSGAGYDGMAMIDVADIGMVFVRCRGGISHHPDEHVETADARRRRARAAAIDREFSCAGRGAMIKAWGNVASPFSQVPVNTPGNSPQSR